MSNVNNREDAFGRQLNVGDEVGGQAWGYKGSIHRMTVKGFTDKKVRVMVHIPERSYTDCYGKLHVFPASDKLTHAFANEIVKTGVNTNDD